MRIAVPLLLLSSLAHAGDAPTGSRCVKSNDCASKDCFEKTCKPSGNHPGPVGAICTSSTHCLSGNCVGHKRCGPKEVKSSGGSKPRGGGQSAPIEEEEESTPAAPVEAPLPTPTPCSDDLVASVYAKTTPRTAQFYAHEDCTHYAPEVIARAKELLAAGYGGNFGITLRTAKEATPDQLACAKKSYDKTGDPKSRRNFEVPSLCLEKKELIACAQDLATTVFKGDQQDGKRECERRSPAVISQAKALFLAGYGDSFVHICDVIETATPEQLECTKRNYEFLTAGRTKYGGGFVLQGPCKRDPERIDCYFALMSVETPEKQYDDRNRAALEDACAKATPEIVALTRSMRALGFNQWLSGIVSEMERAKPAQRECLKRLKAANVTEADKAERDFRIPKACAK